MIIVRNPFVAARRAVDVSLRVAAAIVRGCTRGRILGADLKHVIVHMIAVHMMEMSVVQVIDVIAVLDGHMPAI
jgi:hypothetical protein